MALDKPTNSKGYARLLLKHIFSTVRDSARVMPPMEYTALAEQIGLSKPQLDAAIRELKGDHSISLNNTTQGIALTFEGIQRGSYLESRAQSILQNDPLPESRAEVRMEMGYLAQERSRTLPGTPEWGLGDGRK